MKLFRSKIFYLFIPIFLFMVLLIVLNTILQNSTFDVKDMIQNDYSQYQSTEYMSGDNTIDVVYANKEDGKVIVYFHGNTGRVNSLLQYLNENHSFIAMAYPGYHRSTGSPNVPDTLKAVQGLYPVILNIFGEQAKLYVLAHSLGSQTGSYFVNLFHDKNKIVNLSIVGGFHSIKQECQKVLGPAAPLCFIANNSFAASSYLQNVDNINIYFYHLTNDPVVNYQSGRSLFESLPTNRKQFTDLTSRTHRDFDIEMVVNRALAE